MTKQTKAAQIAALASTIKSAVAGQASIPLTDIDWSDVSSSILDRAVAEAGCSMTYRDGQYLILNQPVTGRQ